MAIGIVAGLAVAAYYLFSSIYVQIGIYVAGAIPVIIILTKKTRKIWGHVEAGQIALPAVSTGVLVVIVLIAALAGGHTVTPLDYVTVTFSGYDGAGSAAVEISDKDLEGMKTYYKSRLKFNDESEESGSLYLATHGYESPVELLAEYMKQGDECGLCLSSDSGLSDGDTITIHWTFFEKSDEVAELMSHLDGDLECADTELTVSGLQTPSHVTSLSDIPEEDLVSVQAEGERIFAESVESTWDSSERRLNSIRFLGWYFFEAKNLSENRLFAVYEVQPVQYGTGADGGLTEEPFTYYWTVCFYNCDLTDEGRLFTDYTHYAVPGSDERFFFTTYDGAQNVAAELEYNGFQAPDEILQTVFTDYAYYWSLESTVPGSMDQEGF